MRQYGSFLMNLLNDASGQTVLNQADQLARLIQNKPKSSSSSTGMTYRNDISSDVIFDEDTAVLVISCAGDKQGAVISTANTGACSMFGCSTGDLVGSSINSIVPTPFNAVPDTLLQAYLQAERAASCANHNQHMFACRRNGTIFPVALQLRQVTGGLQSNSFIAVISEIKVPSSEHYCLYDQDTDRVKAVSAGCAALLGLDARQLSDAGAAIPLKQVLPVVEIRRATDTGKH